MKQVIKLFLFYILKESISFFLFIPGLIFMKRKFYNRSVLYVLNYHNFSKYNNYKIKRGSIIEKGYSRNFEKQIRFLKKYFSFCYPEVFFHREPNKGVNILITFDDGYKDNYNIAFPLLSNLNYS